MPEPGVWTFSVTRGEPLIFLDQERPDKGIGSEIDWSGENLKLGKPVQSLLQESRYEVQ